MTPTRTFPTPHHRSRRVTRLTPRPPHRREAADALDAPCTPVLKKFAMSALLAEGIEPILSEIENEIDRHAPITLANNDAMLATSSGVPPYRGYREAGDDVNGEAAGAIDVIHTLADGSVEELRRIAANAGLTAAGKQSASAAVRAKLTAQVSRIAENAGASLRDAADRARPIIPGRITPRGADNTATVAAAIRSAEVRTWLDSMPTDQAVRFTLAAATKGSAGREIIAAIETDPRLAAGVDRFGVDIRAGLRRLLTVASSPEAFSRSRAIEAAAGDVEQAARHVIKRFGVPSDTLFHLSRLTRPPTSRRDGWQGRSRRFECSKPETSHASPTNPENEAPARHNRHRDGDA